jgi:hypothetical protein
MCGFRAYAAVCVSHCHAWPVRWGCEVEVFGTAVKPAAGPCRQARLRRRPVGEERKLLEAARFMDTNECMTIPRRGRWPAAPPPRSPPVDEACGVSRNVAKSIGKGDWLTPLARHDVRVRATADRARRQ